ncbi:MAG: hypothetical protein R6V29_08300, partial [Spirochaetia bacterium]
EAEAIMAKTITLRVDEQTYDLIRKAAAGERRSLANFIEHATVSYLAEEAFVDDSEMQEMLGDNQLTEQLRSGRKDIESGEYTIV